MHDIHHKRAPPNLLDLFKLILCTHINSPSATGIEFYTRLTQQNHSFSRLGCKIWNEITEALFSKSKTPFKKCLQK